MLPPQMSSDSDSALIKGTEGSSTLDLTSTLSPLSSSPSPSPLSSSSSSSRIMNKPSMPSMPLISSTSTSPPTTGNAQANPSYPGYPPPIIDLDNDHASRFQGQVESRVGAPVRRDSLDPLESPPPVSLLPSSPSSSYPYPYAPPSRPSSAAAFLTPSEVGVNLNPNYGPVRPVLSGQLESGSLRGQHGRVRGLDLGVGVGSGAGRTMMNMVRVPSEETRVLARAQQQQRRSLHAPHSTRPLVVLYRLDTDTDIEALAPPSLPFRNGNGNGRGRGGGSRSSMFTPAMDRMSGSGSSSMRSMSSRHSIMSGDSRLPLITASTEYEYEYDVHPHLHLHPHQQLVAYASEMDALIEGDEDDGEDDDWLHDPRVSFYAGQGKGEGERKKRKTGYVEDGMSYRGIGNYFMIWLILLGLVALFVFYPVLGLDK
ncbi:hypothetical protein DFH05DRAFT_1501080 [Lentinula detonsa]|uniref:Uncharacterized protein n=1 Tax=Lentinula detonsa TaxID=2804962 RepID=A0A9W8TWB4_9AGAR|nr:hypothetical protein DFH05DRAFT_1501080 [Lentinula detonsa]